MPLPRRLLVDDACRGAFHLISRCVRRAYLCGDAAEHRRAWVRDLLRHASGAFAVDVLAYAVMSNHLHVVVRTDPERVMGWSASEVANRWASAHPRLDRDGALISWSATEIATRAADAGWVAKTRLRLRSISWFMKAVKEHLARRANREDHCTGAFWEGRFRSVALLDQAAVIAAMAYVDLNPIRAGLADRPEDSAFTSVQDRCAARQDHQARQVLAAPVPTPPLVPITPITDAVFLPTFPIVPEPTAAEAGLWIAPILAATVDIPIGAPLTPFITLDDYLTLVDTTGRIVRSGKRGAIPATLAPILDRLRLDLASWLDLMARGGQLRQGAIGNLAHRAREALRRGARWIVDRTVGLYCPDPPGMVA